MAYYYLTPQEAEYCRWAAEEGTSAEQTGRSKRGCFTISGCRLPVAILSANHFAEERKAFEKTTRGQPSGQPRSIRSVRTAEVTSSMQSGYSALQSQVKREKSVSQLIIGTNS